jgi:hypothetical protein
MHHNFQAWETLLQAFWGPHTTTYPTLTGADKQCLTVSMYTYVHTYIHTYIHLEIIQIQTNLNIDCQP